MRDDKRIIEVDGVKYAIDRTFDDSPAIYQHAKEGHFHHVDDVNSKTHISSFALGDDDMVIILARKVK